MNKRFSSLSNANCYEDLRGKECRWKNKTGDTAGTYDVIENDYYSRSIINDEILKKKHILFVGDSFVFGHGVTHVDTMGVHFEELLNNDEYCIINLGVPGAAYEHAFLRLQQWCNQFGDNIHSVYFGISDPFRKMYIQQVHYTPVEGFAEDGAFGKMYIQDTVDSDSIPDNLYDSNNIEIIDFNLVNIPLDVCNAESAHRAFYKYSVCRPAIDILAQWDHQVAMLKTQGKAYRFNTCTFQTASQILTSPVQHDTIKQHVDVLEGFPKFTYCLQQVSHDKLGDAHIIAMNDRHWNSLGNKQVAFNLLKETKHWYD